MSIKKFLKRQRILKNVITLLGKRLPATFDKIDRLYDRLDYLETMPYMRLAYENNYKGTSGVYSGKKRGEELIVSLTTYGVRLPRVYMVIESLMNQTVKADRIILWIDQDEIDYDELPEMLKMQVKRGLEVRFCENLKSYKKLIPSLKTFPEAVIITVDDDIIFPVDHIEILYNSYLKDRGSVHCFRAFKMSLNKNKTGLNPYQNWGGEISQGHGHFIFPTGGAGCLYPPNCFAPEVMDINLFTELCPNEDDAWFKFMALKNGFQCKVVSISMPAKAFMFLPGSQDNALFYSNLRGGQSDIQIKKILGRFPEILDILRGAEGENA